MKSKTILTEDSAHALLTNDSTYWLRLYKGFNILLGTKTSVYLSNLIDKSDYFRKNNKLDNQGYFFTTKEWIEIETGINKTTQIKLSKNLCKLNLLQTKVKGCPKKKYYKINIINILNLLHKIETIRKEYIEKNDTRKTIKTEDLSNYKIAIKNITVEGIVPTTMKINYADPNETGEFKQIKDGNKIINKDYAKSLIKANIYNNTKDNKNNTFINKSIKEKSEDFPNNSSIKKNIENNNNILKDTDTNISINKENNNMNTPFIEIENNTNTSINKNKEIQYNILLQEEYSDFLKLFKAHGLNIQTGRNTKVCKYIYETFQNLQAGKFLYHKELKSSIDRNKINILFTKKWNRTKMYNRINKVLNRFYKLFYEEGYRTPKNKPNAQMFFYNIHSKRSYFIELLFKEPVKAENYVSDVQLTKITENFEKIGFSYSKLVSAIYNNSEFVSKWSDADKNEFMLSVWSLYKWYSGNKDNFKLFGYKYTWSQMLNNISRYIDQVRAWDDKRPRILSIGDLSWQYFCKWIRAEYNMDFNFTEKRITKRREAIEKSKEKKVIKQTAVAFDDPQLVDEKAMELYDQYGDDTNTFMDFIDQAKEVLRKQFTNNTVIV